MPDKYIISIIGFLIVGAVYGLTKPVSKIMEPLPLPGQLLALTFIAVSIMGTSYGLFILIRRYLHG